MPKGLQLGFNFIPMPRCIVDEGIVLEQCEFQLLMYLIRHQIGFGFDKLRISDNELENGRRNKDGTRKDKGCGLSRNSIKKGRDLLLKRGWIVYEADERDNARPIKYYSVVLENDEKTGVSNSDEQGCQTLTGGVSNSDSRVSNSDTRSINRQVLIRQVLNREDESQKDEHLKEDELSNLSLSLKPNNDNSNPLTQTNLETENKEILPESVKKESYAKKAFEFWKDHFANNGRAVGMTMMLDIFLSTIKTEDDYMIFEQAVSLFRSPNVDGIQRAFNERKNGTANKPSIYQSNTMRKMTVEMGISKDGLRENELDVYMDEFPYLQLNREMFGKMSNGNFALRYEYRNRIG